MKKILSVLAGLAFAVVCADTGFAAVTGTAHDVTVGTSTGCSACHIPHKSVGKRLWPSNMSTQEATFGEVGALCYYCHGNAGGANLAAAVQPNVMDATVSAVYSHGLTYADRPLGGDGTLASTLPYANKGTFIECTSCHNVHDDSNRPFLQLDIDVLCSKCHTARNFVGGAVTTTIGAWGATNNGLTNPGSHPVGTDITGNVFGGNTPITLAAVFTVAKNPTAGTWSLGGHLATTGTGVTCTTCHAVHGYQIDVAGAQASPTPVADRAHLGLIVISQDTSDSLADGNGTPRNGLCEGCHTGAATTWDAAANGNYAGANEPNPGGTAYSHPVDDLGAQYAGSVPNGADFPTGAGTWPVGSAAGTNMDPAVICESCHTPHPAADVNLTAATGRDDSAAYILVGSGNPILRDTSENLCGDCHTGAIAGHHPVGTYVTARFDAAGIGDNASPLTCGDCHNGNGAHNWIGEAMAGLDPQWLPLNNGRTATDTKAGENNTGASTTCTDCHTGTNNHFSPTSWSANDGAVAGTTLSGRTRTAYQDYGDGSHYLGDSTSAINYTTGWLAGAAFNATTATTWGASPNGAGWSRFDSSGTNHVVCESCHDIEPDKNSGVTKPMLLGNYIEGAAIDPSDLCEACHSQTPGGAQPHPMTGDSISRAQLAGASAGVATLITSGRYTKALASWTGGSTAPAADQTNCDSCHQPHDASTNGGTYIYESNLVLGTAGAGVPADGHPPRGSSTTGLQDLAFCNNCHAY